MNLELIFKSLLSKYSSDTTLIKNLWNEININYSHKNRHYHNLTHLSEIFKNLKPLEFQIEKIDTLYFSIFYHDIIYSSIRKDNELKSAQLFKHKIEQTSFSNLDETIKQIELTKDHLLSNDKDTNIFLDLDLQILGSKKSIYVKYLENIRKEYSIFPDYIYNKGRKKALKSILNQKSIFKTKYFIDKFEKQAKENLLFEISIL